MNLAKQGIDTIPVKRGKEFLSKVPLNLTLHIASISVFCYKIRNRLKVSIISTNNISIHIFIGIKVLKFLKFNVSIALS